MAYNGYGMPYPSYYTPNIGQTMVSPTTQQMNTPQNAQIQSGGFIPVPSEDVARNYPVAPGNSVTFKNENAPYVYTKTMGFSQLDRPIFEKYKLVKEDDPVVERDHSADPCRCDGEIAKLKTDIEEMWGEINELKKRIKREEDIGA